MAIESNLSGTGRVFIGTDTTLRYTIYDADATADTITAGTASPVNVSGWTFAWILRAKDTSPGAPLIEKRSDDSPAAITVTGNYDSDPVINTQRVEVFLLDTDTAAQDGSAALLKPKVYRYALKRTDEDAETILAFGECELMQVTAL